MTEKEAISEIKAILEEATETEDAVSYVTSVDAESLNLAIEALEKQIPNKPAERRDKYTGNYPMYCPNCGTYVAYRDGRTFVLSRFIGSSRCPECGQAIDFGE